MAGIYIHIPFCRSKCNYCNFFSVVSQKKISEVLISIERELALKRDCISEYQIDTIYFGGGTPSLIPARWIAQLLAVVKNHYRLAVSPEITIEANPDDISKPVIDDWQGAGITRISLGVQSFNDRDLRYLNRLHDSKQALKAVEAISSSSFDSFSVDLVFGIPGADMNIWKHNLSLLTGMGVPHISVYGLTVEEKTPLYHFIQKNKMKAPNEEDMVRQFEQTMLLLQHAGYDHYEISNYAKPGHYSKHNTAYWTSVPYLGFGPSAHSFFHQTRGWNASSIHAYLEDIAHGNLFSAAEKLSLSDRYNEYILTGMRTSWGIDLNYIEKTFGMSYFKKCLNSIASMHDTGWICQSDNILTLTKKGKLVADYIIMKLFEL